jgi:hypothetical protein
MSKSLVLIARSSLSDHGMVNVHQECYEQKQHNTVYNLLRQAALRPFLLRADEDDAIGHTLLFRLAHVSAQTTA